MLSTARSTRRGTHERKGKERRSAAKTSLKGGTHLVSKESLIPCFSRKLLSAIYETAIQVIRRIQFPRTNTQPTDHLTHYQLVGAPCLHSCVLQRCLSTPTMIHARLGRDQVRERVAVTEGAPGEAGRVQRLPHLEPPRSVRGRVPLTGPADDGPDTPAVGGVTTPCCIPISAQAAQHDESGGVVPFLGAFFTALKNLLWPDLYPPPSPCSWEHKANTCRCGRSLVTNLYLRTLKGT